jgi:hypothetical protein
VLAARCAHVHAARVHAPVVRHAPPAVAQVAQDGARLRKRPRVTLLQRRHLPGRGGASEGHHARQLALLRHAPRATAAPCARLAQRVERHVGRRALLAAPQRQHNLVHAQPIGSVRARTDAAGGKRPSAQTHGHACVSLYRAQQRVPCAAGRARVSRACRRPCTRGSAATAGPRTGEGRPTSPQAPARVDDARDCVAACGGAWRAAGGSVARRCGGLRLCPSAS